MSSTKTKSAMLGKEGKPTPSQLEQAERICREFIREGTLNQNETYEHIMGGYRSGYRWHDSGVCYSGSASDLNAYIERVDKKYQDWEIARVILNKIRQDVFGLPLTSTTIVKLLDIKDEEIPKKPCKT